MSNKKRLTKKQEEKAENIMILWEKIEKELISEFYKTIDFKIIEKHCKDSISQDYLQIIGHLFKVFW